MSSKPCSVNPHPAPDSALHAPPSPPCTLPFTPAGIPDELQTRRQWIGWAWTWIPPTPTRAGKWTKVPKNPHTGGNADTTIPATWGTLAQAMAAAARWDWGGVGFVFTRDDPYFGIDSDDAFDPETGELTDVGQALLRQFPTYAEPSVTGRGLHLIGRTETFPHEGSGNKRGPIECYWHSRFFACTGQPLPERQAIQDIAPATLRTWHAATFPAPTPIVPSPAAREPVHLDDRELLKRCLENPRFRALHEAGDLKEYAGDASAADLGYCDHVVRNGGSPEQADRLHRAGALTRPKWDERRGDATYGERTLARAFDGTILPPAAAAADPCLTERDTIAQLRAENAELRRQLHVAEQRASERDHFERLYMGIARVLRNPNLRSGEKTTGLSLIVEMENAKLRGKTDDDGWVEVPLERLAERTKCSAGTAGKHVDRLASAGIIESETKAIPGKRYWRRVARFPTAETDDGTAPTLADRLATLANAAPERDDKGWGGDRRCPDHPNAGTITTTTTTVTCAEPGCGQIIGTPVTRRRPSRVMHDAALAETEIPAPSAPNLLVMQDAALGAPAGDPLVIENDDLPFSTAEEDFAEPLVPQDDGLVPRLVPRPGGILERVRDPNAPRAAPPPLISAPNGEPERDAWTG